MYKNIKKDALAKNIRRDYDKYRDKSTGIPVQMKHYIESKTGLSYDDVRIHYNSDRPRQFKALGYTQGNNIFLQHGQEKHLMHELCHIAQQKKGIVKPTSLIGEYVINDNTELENEAELCEEQYKREAPIQMLREKVAQGSEIMGEEGLKESAFKYHTIAYYTLEGYGSDAVWSNSKYWMDKGGGDHAEDAICDQIEILSQKDDLSGKSLCIYISSSPCERCQERLNDLVNDYGLKIKVICAKKYGGQKGGGAGSDDSRQYDQEILEGERANELLQF